MQALTLVVLCGATLFVSSKRSAECQTKRKMLPITAPATHETQSKANPKVRRHTRYVTDRSLYDLPTSEDPVVISKKKGNSTLQLAKERLTLNLQTTPNNFFV